MLKKPDDTRWASKLMTDYTNEKQCNYVSTLFFFLGIFPFIIFLLLPHWCRPRDRLYCQAQSRRIGSPSRYAVVVEYREKWVDGSGLCLWVYRYK